MTQDSKEDLKKLWEKEITVRKEAQRWGILSGAGFIGLVGTEIPEFFSKDKGAHSKWRLPLFVASSVSVVVGVVMNWVRGGHAEKLREEILMIEHTKDGPNQPPCRSCR